MLALRLRVPVPAKITVRVLAPIDLKLLGAKPDISVGYRLIPRDAAGAGSTVCGPDTPNRGVMATGPAAGANTGTVQ